MSITAVVADTNVFVHDPEAIDHLRKNGQILCVPWTVILELDKLKDRPDIGIDAREAMAKIENLRLGGEETLKIIRTRSFRSLPDLDPKVPDHQIIATARTLSNQKAKQRSFSYDLVKLLSRDRPVRVLAREVGVTADDYCREAVSTIKRHSLAEINVPSDQIDRNSLTFPYCSDIEPFEENQGVICCSDFSFSSCCNNAWGKNFAAIHKEEKFKIILPGIQAYGVRPFLLNGNTNGNQEKNWAQYIALAQLMDPAIELVFLQGGAGSGKTLLAIASALEKRRDFRQIIITRPMIHLEDEDRMGFLPGGEEQKMGPWLRPIMQALDFLKDSEKENGPTTEDTKARKKKRHPDEKTGSESNIIDKLLESKKIDFMPLDYIRGMTFCRTFLLVDEAQNLTPHQVKTIITRAGMGTKIVFTGDLGQIDRRRRLDERSNGLAYAISTMRNHERVGIATFKETVRSPLAQLAEERM